MLLLMHDAAVPDKEEMYCSCVPCHTHQLTLNVDETKALSRGRGAQLRKTPQSVWDKIFTLQCHVVLLEALVSLRSSQECLHVARIEL